MVTDSVRLSLKPLATFKDIKLVIIDMATANNEGYDLLIFIKTNRKYEKIPILVCSAEEDLNIVKKNILMGGKDFIIKPLRTDVLIKKIRLHTITLRQSIMIVANNKFVIENIKRSISYKEVNLTVVKTAKEAIDKASELKTDIIITDKELPDMTGLDLLGEIKEKYPNIVVILITDARGELKGKDAVASGADGFIEKPFRNKEVQRKLHGFIFEGG